MKKIFVATVFALFGFTKAQTTDAFKGKGDIKYQVGANFQSRGTGVITSLDYGLGESFSVGAQAGYLLGYKEIGGLGKPNFGDRFDIKARASAHLGGVLKLPRNIDVYPGLDLGLKNFGAHLGTKVFFEKGFGLFAEMQFPIAKYNTNASTYQLLNNQFNFSVGASFDLSK